MRPGRNRNIKLIKFIKIMKKVKIAVTVVASSTALVGSVYLAIIGYQNSNYMAISMAIVLILSILFFLYELSGTNKPDPAFQHKVGDVITKSGKIKRAVIVYGPKTSVDNEVMVNIYLTRIGYNEYTYLANSKEDDIKSGISSAVFLIPEALFESDMRTI